MAVPTFDAIGFAGGNTLFDTRDDSAKVKCPSSDGKAGILCVLMEDPK